MNLLKIFTLGGMTGGWSYFAYIWWRASHYHLGRITLITDAVGENFIELLLFIFLSIASLYMAIEELKK